MSSIETFGGCCPVCLKQMVQKDDSSSHALKFDACPWCGFLYFTRGNEYKKEDIPLIWGSILDHHHVSSREELILKFNLSEYTSKDNMECFPSIWNHSNDEETHPMYKLLWKQYGARRQENFSGKRVTVADYQKKTGIIVDYCEGDIFILWDDVVDDGIPSEHPAIFLGTKIMFI